LSQDEMKRVSAYLPDPIADELEEWAKDESRSTSSLINFLLERAVREYRKERERQNPLDRPSS
jgi:hypothetical protein